MTTSLITVDALVRDITTLSDPGELKEVADKCSAIGEYYKRSGATLTVQNVAAEARLRVVRRLGEVLLELHRSKGGRRPKKGPAPPSFIAQIREAGIVPAFAERSQNVAKIEPDDFEDYIACNKANELELTLAGLLATKATQSGLLLEDQVAAFVALEFPSVEVLRQFSWGRRITGANARIDIICRPPIGPVVAIECKYQSVRGTAEDKAITELHSVERWPFMGILVWSGKGWSHRMAAFLETHPRAVYFSSEETDDLRRCLIMCGLQPRKDSQDGSGENQSNQ
jgi:hypothetical protein